MSDFSDSSEYVLLPKIVNTEEFFNTQYKESELYFITRRTENADKDISGLPLTSNKCYCSVGYRIRSSIDGGLIPILENGFTVEYFDSRYGIIIPGSYLCGKSWTKGSLPSDMNISLWISIHIRNDNNVIYTAGNKGGKTRLTPEVFEQSLKNYGSFKPVSIITPTFNRHHFLPRLLVCIEEQEYKNCEWVILDDSPNAMTKIQQKEIWGKVSFSVIYAWLPKKICVGNKRNILSGLARGNTIINFDDDDLHHPKRISHSIYKMNQSNLDLAGSSCSLIRHDNHIYQIMPYGPYHSTGGLMAFTRKYALNHSFGENMNNAEESNFTDKFTIPLVQLNPDKVILIMSHAENTYDKSKWIKDNLGIKVNITKLKVKNFTRNKKLIKLFNLVK